MRIQFASPGLMVAATGLFLALALAPAAAQVIELDANRLRVATIDSAWRFHLGDDRLWAQASFDDGSWSVFHPLDSWREQGYPVPAEFAWFRIHLRIPANTLTLLLQLPRIEKNYQLYCDGQLVGQVGKLPPEKARAVMGAPRVFTLLITTGAAPRDIVLALRLWQEPDLAGTRAHGISSHVYAGQSEAILRQFSMAKAARLLTFGDTYSITIVVLIVAAATLLLFYLTRERFHLWFAFYLATVGANSVLTLASTHFAWTDRTAIYGFILADLLGQAAMILFILDGLAFATRRRLVLPLSLALLSELGPILVLEAHLPLIWADTNYFFASNAVNLVVIWYLLRGRRSGTLYAKLLFIPFVISALVSSLGNLSYALVDFGFSNGTRVNIAQINVLNDPFAVTIGDFGQIISLLGFLAVLVYRFARTSREEQRLASGMQAARDIQRRLVPSNIPVLTGLHTEIVYLAAEEVGGDFCQILPRRNGSILIAIGDVSGKGLQAAMLGALAVGALRSIADEEIGPAEALNRLNHVLSRNERSMSGFITCLCLVLTASGELTLANAGHLAPYVNGEEMELDSGIPLGVVQETKYRETHSRLPLSARLTLLSDGVVEARSQSGELFGFDRTTRISRLPASEIASKAHEFGQQDDITVITLDWDNISMAPATP